jgi:hypothetical protein
MDQIFACGTVIFSVLAAVLWLAAAFVWVNATSQKPGADGYSPAQISEGNKDVLETAFRQTRWNRAAAACACVAAACQAAHAWTAIP